MSGGGGGGGGGGGCGVVVGDGCPYSSQTGRPCTYCVLDRMSGGGGGGGVWVEGGGGDRGMGVLVPAGQAGPALTVSWAG